MAPWLAAALAFAGPASAQRFIPVPRELLSAARAPAREKPNRDVQRFSARVEAALAEAHAQKAFWGILVTDRDTEEVLYNLNADRFFTPASNAKLFTTVLALSTLGPDFRFRTTLESKGSLGSDGRLASDLILVGRGDPDLSNRVFPFAAKVQRDGPVEKALADLADKAVAKGLKEVDGDIVADDSYYPYDPYPAGWTVGDLFFTFGAPVSAISFNDNSISVMVQPGEHIGDPAAIVVSPEAALPTVSDSITTTASGGDPELGVTRQPGAQSLYVFGFIPLGHVPASLDLAMIHPAETAARALKQLLEARGVHVTGGIRVQHGPPAVTCESLIAPAVLENCVAPPALETLVLAEHLSPPLLESIGLTNKISQNLHAELFLRAAARVKSGAGLTDSGIWAEQDFLKAAGIDPNDVVLTDGSGLSPDDLVTPRAVVELLQYASRQAWGQEFISTLPVAGVDGTLENRMKDTLAMGRIQAKTGALENVRAMSGFATTLRGEHLVFSMFGNNNPQHGRDATETLDAIANAMVETLGAPPRRKTKK